MFSLKKVKHVNDTYKVYDDKARPFVKIDSAVFIDESHIKIDETSLLKILGVEEEINKIVSDYDVIGSVKTIVLNNKKTTVVHVDKKNIKYQDNQLYTLVIVCRSVRYVDGFAIINWMIDGEITPIDDASDESGSEEEEDNDSEGEDSEDDSEEDTIEPPTEELLNMKLECSAKVEELLQKLLSVKDEIESCSIQNIPMVHDQLKYFYNDDNEK